MAKIQAIFFDIGDTLIFDEPPVQKRLLSAYRSIGLPVKSDRMPSAFRRIEDYVLEEYVKGVPPEEPSVMQETITRLTAHLDLPLLDEAQFTKFVQNYAAIGFQRVAHPQALALLAELRRRGFRIGVVSDWDRQLPDMLQSMDIAASLDALAVSALVGVTKPNPAIFLEALRQIDLPAEQVLHVGDYYELDVAGARAAGIQPLLFDWKGRKPDCDCPRLTTFEALAAYLLALPPPLQKSRPLSFAEHAPCPVR